jgi:hypothetical protein
MTCKSTTKEKTIESKMPNSIKNSSTKAPQKAKLDINKAFRLKTLVESGNFDLTLSG